MDSELMIRVILEAKARAELLSKSLEQHHGMATATQLKELVDIFLLMLAPIQSQEEDK